MYGIFASLIIAFVTCLVATLAASAQVTIDWSPVGNPGNATDPTVMLDGTSGYGAVGYNYRIGTYDVTNSQYVEFLNLKDPTGAGPLRLYNSNMSCAPFGGIDYNAGNADGSKYSVSSGDGNHPVNFVSWYDAIRFANWLNNGQGNGDTETGAYTLLGGTPTPTNGDSIIRNPGATVFLPSENEWYKAAYYNPATSSYYQFPTSSNLVPTATSPTATPNSANYAPGGPLVPTDVGAYTGTTSPYGAFDMGGNSWQWIEPFIGGSNRGIRGGSFAYSSNTLQSSDRSGFAPTFEGSGSIGFGFRVASIPEPSTLVLAALGGLALLACRLRRICHDRAVSARHGEIC